jgi:hypothetical protein
MDSLERALSLGLVLIPVSPFVLEKYVEDRIRGKTVNAVNYCIIRKVQSISPTFAFAKDYPQYAVVQWRPDNTFTLVVNESHPGPGDTDFIASFETFEDVLDAAVNLYFGQPLVIGGWMVPLHHHPELSEAQVRRAIAQAQTITVRKFDLLQQEYQRSALRQFPDNIWEQAFAGSFLRLAHTSEPQVSCMLLRNGQIAFIVHP